MTPPVELGLSASPKYRVAPTIRFQRALATLSQPPVIRGVAPRRTAQSSGNATVNLRARIEIRELKYPGQAGNAERVNNKWVYLFNLDSRTCELEGEGTVTQSGGQHHQAWRYTIERLTASSQRTSRQYNLVSTDLIELANINGEDSSTTWAAFLSPFRLSHDGMEFLLNTIGTSAGRTDAGSPLTKLHWLSASRGVAWVPDPFIWAEDAFWMFESPRLERQLRWHANADRQARLFVASTLKSLIAGGVDRIENNLNSGQPNTYLNAQRSEQRRLARASEHSAGYVSQCVDAPEHRAVELSAKENGGNELSACLQHWAVALSGKQLTQNGRQFLRVTVRENRVPTEYLFADSPPSNSPSWGEARYAYIAARQIMAEILPAWLDWKRATMVSANAEQWQRVTQKVGEYVERLYQEGGRRSVSWRQRAIRREIRSGAAIGSSRPAGQTSRVEREFRQMILASGQDVPADPGRVTSSVDTRWEGWTSRMGRLNRILMPIQALAEIYNLCAGISTWQSANANESTVDFFGVLSVRSSAVGAVGAATDFGAWCADIAAMFGRITESTAARIAGPLAIVSGATEMLGHGQNAIQSGYGRNNIGAAAASGVAAFGGALGALGGAMALAAEFGLASAAFGHVGIIIGIIGGILVFLGALAAALLTRDPFEQFAEHCFLGDSAGESSGYDHHWSPILPLPRGVVDQVKVLMVLLGAFEIKKDATVNLPVSAWGGHNHRFDAKIKLGYFPPGGVLDIEVEMQFGWVEQSPGHAHTFVAKMTVDEHHTNLQIDTDHSTLILSTPRIVRDSDGRPHRVPLELSPSAVKVNGQWVCLNQTSLQSCQYVKIRAKLHERTNAARGVCVPPYASGWCEATIHGTGAVDSVNTLDPATFHAVR